MNNIYLHKFLKIRLIQPVLLIIGLLLSANVSAADPVFTPLFSNKAIRGYDTVAYFTQNKAVEGKEEFSTEYQGAQWLFSTQEHLDLFLQQPEKYAPQYGGYCAYAVAHGKTASIQPDLFTIVDDKLYLNYNESINEKWLANQQNFIKDADKNWPSVLD